MEQNKLTIKSSFKGVAGQLVKYGVFLIILIAIFIGLNYILKDVYLTYKMNSILDLMTNIFQVQIVHAFEIVVLNILLLILAIFIAIQVFKVIGLLININNKLVFDFDTKKIVNSYYSGFNKIVDENIFENILEVQIEQGFFDSIFDAGNIYIEYTRKDSKEAIVGNLNIDHIYKPFIEKDKLMNNENI